MLQTVTNLQYIDSMDLKLVGPVEFKLHLSYKIPTTCNINHIMVLNTLHPVPGNKTNHLLVAPTHCKTILEV